MLVRKLIPCLLCLFALLFLSSCVRNNGSVPPATSKEEASAPFAGEEFETIDPLEEEAKLSVSSSDAEILKDSKPDAETGSHPAPSIASSPRQAEQPAQNAPTTPAQTESHSVTQAPVPAPEKQALVGENFQLDATRIEQEMLQRINAERTKAGLDELSVEEKMLFAARIRAMELSQSFSHNRPDGTPYYTAFDEAGYDYAGKWHGENIASMKFEDISKTETEIADELYAMLKNSPGQYQNMVGENFLQTGIGVFVLYSEPSIQVDLVQVFSSL